MALVGSLLTMFVVSEALIYFIRFTSDVAWFLINSRLVRLTHVFISLQTYTLPCACFLAILKKKVTWYQVRNDL
jgi:hypothetical protein